MLGFYKKRIYWLIDQLREIEKNPAELALLRPFQACLIRSIFEAEAHIRRLKAKKREHKSHLRDQSNTRVESRRIKSRIDWLEKRIEKYRDAIYIWKCFGDGLAFVYLDKHAIKPLVYETASSNVKQTPGYLSGKIGLAGELALLSSAIDAGVPAILCDLTNSIRHGDLCLLGNSDPYIIEVKASRSEGKRRARQLNAVNDFNEFYANDSGRVMGQPTVTRQAIASPEQNHAVEMNRIAEAALVDGRAQATPEPGLTYIALNNRYRGNPVEDYAPTGPFEFNYLNGAKMSRSWASYYPFTLLLRDREVLCNFILGKLFLIVLYEPQYLIDALQRRGVEAELMESESYGLRAKWPDGDDGWFAISSHYLGRITIELLSIDWVAETQVSLARELHLQLEAGASASQVDIPSSKSPPAGPRGTAS